MRRTGFLLGGLVLALTSAWVRLFMREVHVAERVVVSPVTNHHAALPGVSVSDDRLIRRVHPSNAAALTQALPVPATQVDYVTVNRGLATEKSSPFWRKDGRFEFPLPGGSTVTIVISESEMLGANRFTSVGHIDGLPESRAVFAYCDGFLTGSVETRDHAYVLRPADARASQVYEIDFAQVPPCGGVRHPVITPEVVAAATQRHARQAAAAAAASAAVSGTAAAEAGQRPEIHVMMAYTQAVKTTLSGAERVAALQSEFDAAVAKMNEELAASQITARVKLVRIAETRYDESISASNQVQDDALSALYQTSDGKMDDLHVLRDEAGADVVCLVLNRSDGASIGLSFVLDTPAAVDAAYGAVNPLYAFAVVQYFPLAGTDVFSHEMGHVLGCAHARGDPSATGTRDGAYTYSYGYRFFGTDNRQYRDIMAYAPGSPLAYYSNPRLVVPSPVNAPIGIAAGRPSEADCALTIDQTAFEVASYRLQTQAASAGNLVNVSTRAYVGTGDAVLIGGFYLTGSQPKRILVRGAGPALAAYGVSNALANPRLRVVANGNPVASNDDWGNQPNATEIANAGAQVSAFPFAGGSADAAVLVTLGPGAYSAIVEGANGASGSGLIEVYDVDRTGSRIINLSTRGFADRGREMFGGFVVLGATGTTKRIFIRVLGPSLGRAPFNVSGAMYDPEMALYDGAGGLLLKNDDWSSGTTVGSPSPINDFSPLVKSYSEQQIAATGYAPANRREPAVMLDLPPGNYSVIAQPFERTSDANPEPAQPGVAIIEVYEIAPN